MLQRFSCRSANGHSCSSARRAEGGLFEAKRVEDDVVAKGEEESAEKDADGQGEHPGEEDIAQRVALKAGLWRPWFRRLRTIRCAWCSPADRGCPRREWCPSRPLPPRRP